MSLPTAVKRKAERARQQVAAKAGKPAPAPLQTGGEYLAPDSTSSEQPRVASHIQAVSDDQQSNVAEAGQYRPHSLADVDTERLDAPPTQLSAQDSVEGGQGISRQQLPDFIDEEDWKWRYAALRASRDDRVATLEQQLSELRATNQSLSSKLAKVSKDDQAAERSQFDEKATNAFGKDGAELFNQINDRIDSRLDAQNQSSMSQFESNLDSLVPRWRQINVESGFLQFLSGIDDVVGISRQAILDQIVNDRDANAAAAIFRSYAATVGGEHAQQRNGQHVPELSTSRSSAGLGAEEQLVEEWSESEIADFYQSKSRLYQAGKLNGELLKNVMADEARIRKAMSEGRVYKG